MNEEEYVGQAVCLIKMVDDNYVESIIRGRRVYIFKDGKTGLWGIAYLPVKSDSVKKEDEACFTTRQEALDRANNLILYYYKPQIYGHCSHANKSVSRLPAAIQQQIMEMAKQP